MSPHRHRMRLVTPVLIGCAMAITTPTAAQALDQTHTTQAGAISRSPGDVTLTGGDFGTVEVGESGTTTLTLTNNGTAVDGFDGIPLTLPPGVTRTGGTCDLDAALLPGESCTIELTWTPTTEGHFAGTVSLTADEDGVTYPVSSQVSGDTPADPTPSPSPSDTATASPSPSGSSTPGPTATPEPSQTTSTGEPPHLAETGSDKTRTGVLLGLGAAILVGFGAVLTRLGHTRRRNHHS
ncbi:choice-of-anchor D domain-containing protein [Streptomyces sp. NPDC002795]|uniref:choice-of-anchor D domain-containing protein n=1 Tax=Streptomyces sp. NPDC002795 TaxID=3364665 RepID=UPI0036B7B929